MAEMISMSLECEATRPTLKGLWKCVLNECDGVHHYFLMKPWRWSTEDQELPL